MNVREAFENGKLKEKIEIKFSKKTLKKQQRKFEQNSLKSRL